MLEFFNTMTVLNINRLSNITIYLIEYLVKGLFLASAIFSENWAIR